MEERIWPGSEAAAATGEAGEHFGKAVYLFFFKPPSPAPPAVLYFSLSLFFFLGLFFLGFFFFCVCSLSEVLLGLAVCSSLLSSFPFIWCGSHPMI